MRKEIKKSGIDKAFVQEDIAERKQMEKKQSLRLEILKTFHQYGLLKNMCERAVSLIKEYLDCEVVAMRLKEGEDYPYFINNGFTKKFIESENYLSIHDEKGDCLRDSQGRPLLACMCGIIINAEYSLDKPFFTKNGSFWTNSTTELLASTTEEDRGTTTRNVCNEYGYESAALIPIKSGSYNIGLLQINDRRRKLFTSENLEFLEELGHILGIAVERNKAEEEIKNLAKFPSENPYPVLRIAKDGTVLYANEAAIPLLNDWGCRVGRSAPEQWRHLIRNAVDTDTRKNIELKYKGKVFSLALIPVVSAEYVNLYGLDITEHKLADEVLKRDKETFERLVSKRTHELFKTQAELDKAKRLSDLGTLAATVAHELRNPLGVIKIASYNIRKKRENSLLDKHLDNIEKKVSESGQIINNLLSYSRIKISSYEKIQIYDILNECIAFAKRRFHKQNVSIVKKFKLRKKKFIEADPLQIREIFNNILTNAYQSVSNKKGKIEISERDDGKGSIEISFKDNGIGIGKKDLERIFEPFFTRKSKGTGLGLTICNELVNLHGGRIDIKSKKGKGTSITVSLPIKRETK